MHIHTLGPSLGQIPLLTYLFTLTLLLKLTISLTLTVYANRGVAMPTVCRLRLMYQSVGIHHFCAHTLGEQQQEQQQEQQEMIGGDD